MEENEKFWTRERYALPKRMTGIERYDTLAKVLQEAFNRAAFGKGSQRHARGYEKFEDQYIIRGSNTFGVEGLYFQIGKKLEECVKLPDDRKINELLDIMVYAAAAIIVTRGKGGAIGQTYAAGEMSDEIKSED